MTYEINPFSPSFSLTLMSPQHTPLTRQISLLANWKEGSEVTAQVERRTVYFLKMGRVGTGAPRSGASVTGVSEADSAVPQW